MSNVKMLIIIWDLKIVPSKADFIPKTIKIPLCYLKNEAETSILFYHFRWQMSKFI